MNIDETNFIELIKNKKILKGDILQDDSNFYEVLKVSNDELLCKHFSIYTASIHKHGNIYIRLLVKPLMLGHTTSKKDDKHFSMAGFSNLEKISKDKLEEYKIKNHVIINKNYDIQIDKIHWLFDMMNKNKVIELNKEYFASEWSWSPMCDGIYVYPETIREHITINGIDVYFTNKNNRIYFKEDLYETNEEAQAMCSWKNSFSYDYECTISRLNYIRQFIDFENCHWVWKKVNRSHF